MSIRFGVSGSPLGGIDAMVDQAVRAEAAGFDSFVIADLAGGLSPLVALAAVAQATERITLGTFVINTGVWAPATLAREWATLSRISGGRVEVGLGSGIVMPALAAIMPASRAARIDRLEETVDALRTAFDEPGITPGFVATPRLLIAGSGERILRLVGERADGLLIATVPGDPKVSLPRGHMVLPDRERTELFFDQARELAGERAGLLEFGIGAVVTLTDDAEAVAAEMAQVHSYLTPEQIRRSPKQLIGTVEEVAAEIIERASTLGLGYQVLRGGTPEELGEIVARVRAA